MVVLGMELIITPELKRVWAQTLAQLSGAARRVFMASVIKGLPRGGASQAQIALGWDRTTLRKGLHELNCGVVCLDAVALRGRKPLEAKLPGSKLISAPWEKPPARPIRPFAPRNFTGG